MAAPNSTTPSGPAPGDGAARAPDRAPGHTGTTLRGAGVDVDVRRVGRAAIGLCLVTLAVVAAILFVVGAHKNAQITRLRQDGVPVTVTVTGCLGLLGGSGSNGAGYACKGRFALDGHRYLESLPGNALHPVGAKVRAVAVAGDPPLLSTRQQVETERASWTVFIVPSVLLLVLAAIVAALVVRSRRSGPASTGPSAAGSTAAGP